MSVAVVTGAASGMGRACAEPGWVDTPGNRATGRMEAALASVPLGRAGTPEEIADLVWFLAGEGRAGYVAGETLTATGGSAFR
jgi:3-oxoacyl-[acyl-carrier protein] reductase